MKLDTQSKLVALSILITILLGTVNASELKIDWYTIDAGGGTSTGGDYALVGTIGQPDAGEMAGGDYELQGGFWPRGPTLALCFVNFEHFAEFALYWLDAPCGPGNDWCYGADLDWSTDVGLSDVGELAYWWLAECPPDWPWQ